MASTNSFKVRATFLVSLLGFKTAHSSNVVPETPKANEVVPVNQPYNITWDPSDASTASSVFIGLLYAGDFVANITGLFIIPSPKTQR